MGRLSLSAIAATAVAGLGLAFAMAGGAVPLPESLASLGSAEPKVLVVVLEEPEAVDAVRRALAPERILVDTGAAIALEGGRILTVDVRSASEPLNQAGWADRRVEIFQLARRAGLPAPGAGRSPGAAAGSAQDLAALMQKPSLSRGEQMAVLKAIDKGAL